MTGTLSTAEVSRIVGMKEPQVRQLVRSGLCRPARRGRRYAFTFRDLVVLQAAQGLLRKRVPAARVRRALAALSDQLPEERPLSGMRIFADGRNVVVRDGDTAWQPETGQTVLDFRVDELVRRAEAVRPAPAAAAAGDVRERARREFERALELEDDDPPNARTAYRRALALDPGLVDARVNLGRLAHEAGDAPEAERHYRRALEHSPDDPVIHFNLALAVEDTRGAAEAVAHYQRALALDPDFADAHYNLGGLCEDLDRSADALRHYHAYKKLTES
ncbi:MAG: tetratricopeptide repeat protein [Proteobacteria bacterium]|nr:tetratricopeptide repeat protein [Pseudomonadota bacterium]